MPEKKRPSINFQTTSEKRKNFNVLVELNETSTVEVLNQFIDKFIKNPEQTLRFIGK